jgi:1-aminocyclopropane-1-carboxylate deaminase/D-cysteine desulfhydrase-like pyridoxal-dependent ACC family enzyme
VVLSFPGPVRNLNLLLPSPLQELRDDRLDRQAVRIYLKRDDLIHPEIPGNKWRKLKYNLTAAADEGHDTLLTFGGAYSNHIRATAAAGYYFGFSTIGVIRGEEHRPLNPTLAYAASRGMRLEYLDRTAYRRKNESNVIERMQERFGKFYFLPEGGSNALALLGCAELCAEIDSDFDVVCCPVGTGGTLAGIAAALAPGRRALGFAALKGGAFLDDEVNRLQLDYGTVTTNWSMELDYHFGGFARRTRPLDDFIDDFASRHGIELEWIYVAKMLYGLFAMTEQAAFKPGTVIIAVVTGPATP